MPSLGEILLLHLLSIFASFTRVALIPTDPQRVKALKEEPEHVAKGLKLPSLQPGLWFDYSDSEKEKILNVYKLIGEEPVFVAPSTFPQQLRLLLVGSVVLILLFFLYQICTKVIGKKGTT